MEELLAIITAGIIAADIRAMSRDGRRLAIFQKHAARRRAGAINAR